MAAMKKSEQMLLGLFAGLLVLAVTFFVLDVVARKKTVAQQREKVAKAQIIEYETLIRQKRRWEVRRAFVEQNQPVFVSDVEQMPDFQGYFRRQAAASVADDGTPVEILSLVTLDPEEIGQGMMALSLDARIKGPASAVLRFLTRLQANDGFYAIRGFAFTADPKNPGTTRIDNLIFSRWYAPNDGSTSSENTAPAGAGTVAKKAVESESKTN